MDEPWLDIIGVNENGLEGLSPAARQALAQAQVIVGAPRHLELVGAGVRGQPWPIPFDTAPVLARRGQPTVVLASGEPFWFGAGAALARHLSPGEWRCHSQPSTFALAAAHLGWALEDTLCLGLHAKAHQELLPHLAPGRQIIALLRGPEILPALLQWLQAQGWGGSEVWIGQALGGPRQRWRSGSVDGLLPLLAQDSGQAPLCMALRAAGGTGLPTVAGRADDCFAHDGQITKAPVRALTLAALAPRRGQRLWDLGAGSGSVAVEWCLAGGLASAVEQNARRIDNIESNRQRFGLQAALQVIHGRTPEALAGLPPPHAVFVGGGFDSALWATLRPLLPDGCRLVVNAVTLQTQALLLQLQGEVGGELLHIQLAQAAPLGRMQAWDSARSLVQWTWQR